VSFLEKLQKRWQVKSGTQVILILIVFACTGSSIIPLKHLLGIDANTSIPYRILFYVGVLPIYNLMLLGYGYLFGQFRFFLEFEKKFFRRIINLFKSKKTKN
jgi:hypothetical protein